MDVAQVVIGVALLALGLVGHLRTRHLLRYLSDLGDRPLAQEHMDRVTVIAWAYHMIAGLTIVAGIAVMAFTLLGG